MTAFNRRRTLWAALGIAAMSEYFVLRRILGPDFEAQRGLANALGVLALLGGIGWIWLWRHMRRRGVEAHWSSLLGPFGLTQLLAGLLLVSWSARAWVGVTYLFGGLMIASFVTSIIGLILKFSQSHARGADGG